MKRLLSSITALGILLSSVSSPLAQTATGTLDMKITVLDGCILHTSGLVDFGIIIDLTNDVGNRIGGPIGLQCTSGTPYSVGLDDGQNADGTQRRMALDAGAGVQYINYELYHEIDYADRWGNTPGVDTRDGISTGDSVAMLPWGRIPGGQQMPPSGTYTDTVQITVTY